MRAQLSVGFFRQWAISSGMLKPLFRPLDGFGSEFHVESQVTAWKVLSPAVRAFWGGRVATFAGDDGLEKQLEEFPLFVFW